MPLQGEAKYRTEGFKEIALIHGTTEGSFRKTSALINRVRHQEAEGTPSRTIRDNTKYEGSKIQDYLEEKTQTILQENGWSQKGESRKVIIGPFCPGVSKSAMEPSPVFGFRFSPFPVIQSVQVPPDGPPAGTWL